MTDNKAKEIIAFRDREKGRQSNFRSLWQSVSDMVFPQTYGIATNHSAGTELMNGLFDTTAVEEFENMANGISNTLFPPGQKFFIVRAEGDLNEMDEVREYLAYVTDQAHDHIANSISFRPQADNTIHYWCTFGTGCLYSDWTVNDGLNYRDYAIGTYQCLENSKGVIDTIVFTFPMTARQIHQDYGEKSGASVLRAVKKPESVNDEFNVIHLVRPRRDREPNRIDNRNMPFESVYVQEKDAVVLDEGGYDEFPFAVPRYDVIFREVYGRGRGVAMLPAIRTLNRLAKDYLEMSNKWVNPPRLILDTFEGQLNVAPGANNYVPQMDAVAAMDMGANGMYPVTKDILEYYREGIRQGAFKSAFEAVTPLTGDRRTTLEISERLKEGMKKLGKPIARMISELLTPTIERSILLLIRNGQIARPPETMQGRNFKLQFIGPLAKALEEYEAKAGMYWIETLGTAAEAFPEVLDNVDADRWARELGESMGVSPAIMRPKRKVEELRAQRAQKMAEQEQLVAAGATADAYNKMTKAPEPGSLVEGE